MNHVYRLVWSRARSCWVAAAELAGSTQSNGSSPARRSRRMRRRRRTLSATTAALASGAALAGQPAPDTLPSGGQVAAGNIAINQSGARMNVVQGSERGIINWQSFDVGRDAQVYFDQPGRSAATLNRVQSGIESQIYGQISAPGQVFLLNQSGIVFGRTARVDVGSLVAGAMDISDADFMAGNYRFTGGQGRITNFGELSAEEAGFIALLAPEIINHGVIRANMGTVALAAGEAVTLTNHDTGLTVVVEQAALDAFIENRHLVKVDDGRVFMSAGAADQLARSAIRNTGTIEAASARRVGGVVRLEASEVTNAGRIDVSGETGGMAIIEADHIALEAGTDIDATGRLGGGQVLVGGDWQGGDNAEYRVFDDPDALSEAVTVSMADGARIDASATEKGDGGTIVLWSDIKNRDSITDVAGTLLARGGAKGGDGGFIETSGFVLETEGAVVRANAPAGRGGLWLLDPEFSFISQSVADGFASTLNTGTNVTNLVSGDMVWGAGVTLTKTEGDDATLTLRTTHGGDITFESGARIESLSGALDVVINADGRIDIAGGVSFVTNGGATRFRAAGNLKPSEVAAAEEPSPEPSSSETETSSDSSVGSADIDSEPELASEAETLVIAEPEITLSEAEIADIRMGGSIDASSIAGAGGTVDIEAERVRVDGSAEISARGEISGGSIRLAGRTEVEILGGGNEDQVPVRIDVSSTSGTGGQIRIESSAVRVKGAELDASAQESGSGGDIVITADEIELDDASLNAYGVTGGGEVLIGGDWQGQGGLPQATRVTITEDVTIDASATDKGDGGTIVAWSDITNAQSRTQVTGTLKARGGAQGGDGGKIETSGYDLKVDGITISTQAPQGRTGQWLLDPRNITISDGTETGVDSDYTATGDSAVINVNTLITALDMTNITVFTGTTGEQDGNITVNAAITSGSTYDLELKAANDIIINENITRSGTGGLILRAGSGSVTGTGDLILGGGTTLTLAHGTTLENDIQLTSGGATITVNLEVEYLIVGGGGGGGGIMGGGGGAGGVLMGSQFVNEAVSLTVGAGGRGGVGWDRPGQFGLKGQDSSFGSLVALGGGGGGAHRPEQNNNDRLGGGSGGGGGGWTSPGWNGGTGEPGQGNDGSRGAGSQGGGGGGAGGAGIAIAGTRAGDGGVGIYVAWADAAGLGEGGSGWFAGGGGGGVRSTGGWVAGSGGQGGGAAGNNSTTKAADGVANTGGGGGGAGYNTASAAVLGGTGGSGIVAVRYSGTDILASGGDVTTVDSGAAAYTVHAFKATGNSTFTLSGLEATLTGNITGTGSLTADATGGTITLAGANAFEGGTTITGGTVKIESATGLGSAGSAVTLSNTADTQLKIAEDLSNVTIGSLAGGGRQGGNVDIGASTKLIVGSAGSSAFHGAITGAGSLEIVGANTTTTLTLSGNSTFTGGTKVTAGSVALLSSNALGTGNITMADGTGMQLGHGVNVANDLELEGDVKFSFAQELLVEYLIVGGGGGGGARRGGGGGGGGFVEGFTVLSDLNQASTITVGEGGLGGLSSRNSTGSRLATSGGASSAFGASAAGGGHGGSFSTPSHSPGTGASGGGGAGTSNTAGANGTSGESGGAGDNYGGGGGGGASQAGANASGNVGGAGGDGKQSDITGVSTWYAGGGAGGSHSGNTVASGGQGGGGDSQTANSANLLNIHGAANTGGGGGGGATNGTHERGGDGGSGIVVVRYLGNTTASGGNASQIVIDGEVYTVHRFTSVGENSFGVQENFDARISGSITGAGKVSIDAEQGQITLSGNSSFTGGTDLDAGTIVVRDSNALGTGDLTMAASTELLLGHKVSIANNITLAGAATIGFAPVQVEYLIVGGGGAGGTSAAYSPGGGGGAGEFVFGAQTFDDRVYSVTVGAGGLANANKNGQSSSVGSLVALGGGGGGNGGGFGGADGGSGGGSGRGGGAGGESTADLGLGNAGGGSTGEWPTGAGAGGGGGAGQAGASINSTTGGKGGDGLSSDITGTLTWYAGGGGGGGRDPGTAIGLGGEGGGGDGVNESGDNLEDAHGAANTGGGGGGRSTTNTSGRLGGNGGSGIVVLRYRGEDEVATGGTITEIT